MPDAIKLVHQYEESPPQLTATARGIRRLNTVSMLQAAHSTTQNYSGTSFLGVAAASTDTFLPNVIEMTDILADGESDKNKWSSRIEVAFMKDFPDLRATVKFVAIREQLLNGSTPKHVPYVTAHVVFAADSKQVTQVEFAYKHGQPGSAIGTMPIATKSAHSSKGKQSFTSGKGTPAVTYQQPYMPASLA